MTTMELNASIYRSLSTISEDENYLKKAAAYLKKLASKKEDEEEPVMTKQEILDGFRQSLEELKLHREGKLEFKSWNDLYNELRR